MRTKPFIDAEGQFLWDAYNGRQNSLFVERDDGFLDSSSNPYFTSYSSWLPYVRRALKLVRGRVLDIGCGAGRHALYLQRKKFDVTGIDNSPLAIKVCRKRGLRRTQVMPIEKLQFPPNSFDSVIMMWANFGLLGNPKKAHPILRKLLNITSPDARIIADVNDPYKTKDPVHLRYHQRNRKRHRLPGQLRLRIRYQTMIGPWFDYLFASKKEVRQIINNTGWKVERFIDSPGSSYIVILRKERQ